MIYKELTQLVGHTPLLDLQRWVATKGIQAQIVAKIEYFNPGGSVKDRVALHMIQDAEDRGALRPGSVIIEPTSGNTGVGLAWVSRVKGYRCIIVMPDNMSLERQRLLRASGAELVLTPGAQGMPGAIAESERIQKNTPNAVIMGQFTNPANPETHELTTGAEIWQDTDGMVDAFVSGVGTGGTLCGTACALRKHNPGIYIAGMEPASSPVLNGGKPGPHAIQGIGGGFIPKTYDPTLVDEVLTVSDDEAINTARELAATEGLLVGISSGAAAYAALLLAKRPEFQGKRIVVLLPDTGERYLSTGLFE